MKNEIEVRLERVAEGGPWRFMSCVNDAGQHGITMGVGGSYVGTVVAPTRVEAEALASVMLTRWLDHRERRSKLKLVR